MRVFVAVIVLLMSDSLAAAQDVARTCQMIADKARAANPAALQQAASQPEAFLRPLLQPAPDITLKPEQMQKITQFAEADAPWVGKVQALGGGDYRASKTEGTLICLEEMFIHVDANGSMHQLSGLPSTEEGLCWRSWRNVVNTAGSSALLHVDQMDQPLLGVNLHLTAWRGGFGPSCRVSIRAADSFHVSEHFCQGDPICRPATALASGLVESFVRRTFDRGHPDGPIAIGSSLTTEQVSNYSPKLTAARKHFSTVALYEPVPSFGVKPKTEYAQYVGGWVSLIDVDGHVLIARIGRSGFGWRDIGDYLVAFYTPSSLTPVASAVVKRQITGLASVEVQPAPTGTN